MKLTIPNELKTKKQWREFFELAAADGCTREFMAEAMTKAGLTDGNGDPWTRNKLQRMAMWSGLRLRKRRKGAVRDKSGGPKKKTYRGKGPRKKTGSTKAKSGTLGAADALLDVMSSNLNDSSKDFLVRLVTKEIATNTTL